MSSGHDHFPRLKVFLLWGLLVSFSWQIFLFSFCLFVFILIIPDKLQMFLTHTHTHTDTHTHTLPWWWGLHSLSGKVFSSAELSWSSECLVCLWITVSLWKLVVNLIRIPFCISPYQSHQQLFIMLLTGLKKIILSESDDLKILKFLCSSCSFPSY